jgi:methylenetetrahydrofolate reductase (NADPH)
VLQKTLKVKVTDHLKKAKKTLFSFEILPPLKGKSIESIYEGIDPLIEFKPSFINVTYHRQEYVYKKREKGFLEKIAIRKRPGTVGICAAIINKFKTDAIPHLICGGFTREETENALIDLQFLGIDNILALRGDPIKTESTFIPAKEGHAYSIDLVKQIVNLNNGQYLDDEIQEAAPTQFCIGVAGYPEKHFEALNINIDLKHLKAKVDAGADYIVTQMFFDNEKYYQFVKICREAGILVPIIPGLKPITNLKHIAFLPKTFKIDLPDAFANELIKCTTDEEVKNIGTEWAIEQSKDLIKSGVPCLHYYTMGKSEAVRKIAQAIY